MKNKIKFYTDEKEGFQMKKFAIIGAGNGGQAFAGYLGMKGYSVKIYDIAQDTVDKLNELGGVTLEGNSDLTGFGKIELATTDMAEVLKGAEIVLMVLPSTFHKSTAEKMAPYLEDGQFVVVNPAAGLGVLEVKKAFMENGCKANIKLASTSTLLFAARLAEVGRVTISGQKNVLSAAAFPASDNPIFSELFADIIPQFDFTFDTIRVTLDNMNALVHPGPTLMYANRIESGISFMYYNDFSPSQGKLVEATDKERLAVADAFGIKVRDCIAEFRSMYSTHGSTMYEALQNCTAYGSIYGQKEMKTRYITEDIPYNLEGIRAMAQIAGVATPVIDSIITIARAIVDGVDEGRTAKNLGIDGMSKDEFLKLCIG